MGDDSPRVVLLAPYNGGLAVARALVRRGEPVTVLANPGDSFTAHSRKVEGQVLPALDDGPDVWIDALKAHGPCVVLTGSDLASEFLAERRDELPGTVRAFERDDDAHLALLSKTTCYEIADRAEVRRPLGATVTTVEELDAVAHEMTYPCILKPALSHLWRAVFGDDRVILAESAAELVQEGRRALVAGLELVIGEYVPGADSDVEEAILVRAEDGSFPVAIGCRKIRQHPAGFGAASICETAPIEESMDMAKRLLDAAGYVGVAGVETKRHAETGERYLLEVNVRIPTQFGLGDAAGGDSSWRLYATLAGLELGPEPELRHGVKLVFPELELHAALKRDGEGPGLMRRLGSWRGAGDLGIFDLRDPGPALALLRRAGASRIGRVVSRATHRPGSPRTAL